MYVSRIFGHVSRHEIHKAIKIKAPLPRTPVKMYLLVSKSGQNTLCAKGSFLLDYCNRGCLPEVKQAIIDMSLNASGVRDTARSLHICPNTVLRALKKKETTLEAVNTALLRTLNPAEVAWDMERAG